MKRALVIGIDQYDVSALTNCEADARRVASLLERNEDGSKNFDVQLLVSDTPEPVSRGRMLSALKILFGSPAEVAVIYFAGHGVFDEDTTAGTLLAQNGEEDQIGIGLHEITALAANSSPGITSSVIILDCCQSGSIGDIAGTERASLGSGVTILTSCDRDGNAYSNLSGGVFTDLAIDALQGSAADVRGNITAAAIYAHVDQSLGAWAQRPIYKANVRAFAPLRTVAPRVEDRVLRRLADWFPNADAHFALDPSFEPEVDASLIAQLDQETLAKNRSLFAQLQLCNRHGLLEPVGAAHMYHAAIESKSCRLTPLGKFYRRLSEEGRF